MNIPARYCTGYLSDIGTPPPYVGDFAGWFEAYLDGHWYTFDPRNNTPRIGRVLMARGRDAADVPLSNTFGLNTLKSFKVWTDEVSEASRQPRERAFFDRLSMTSRTRIFGFLSEARETPVCNPTRKQNWRSGNLRT